MKICAVDSIVQCMNAANAACIPEFATKTIFQLSRQPNSGLIRLDSDPNRVSDYGQSWDIRIFSENFKGSDGVRACHSDSSSEVGRCRSSVWVENSVALRQKKASLMLKLQTMANLINQTIDIIQLRNYDSEWILKKNLALLDSEALDCQRPG